ncbi:uncharacterized protein LOC127808756 isoform X2 [Diospyros lotus]|uniref:uncharacterized protein LOC127808756 isoform X2 n=1 Tax=Diospyros lotus TaxID=55363 RepID=UPI002255C3E2|nr:uncharacterized protein LOC127808756 isoform X2 [Diospyros lotus]
MGDNLFQGLPPPRRRPSPEPPQKHHSSQTTNNQSSPNPPLPPVLKSALKRSKLPDSQPQAASTEKRLRFKMTTDASEAQVIEAMQKIASHIKNPSKFGKASKLAIQLIQAGSVKPGTSEYFFAILESAMASPTACNDTSVRADYHVLFSAAQDAVESFSKRQRNQFNSWMIRAVVANDLFTDDSFVFSKATGRIKEAILDLPVTTKDEDTEEAAALEDETERTRMDDGTKQGAPPVATSEGNDDKDDSDPFGLDALIPNKIKKDEKTKGKKEVATAAEEEEEEESKRYLKSQREALILCLEIAARRYKTPWCQTAIDILVKQAFDNISRFTCKQRDAIEKLWASIREQQARRKHGKSVSGKLDVNAFEWLQQKYASEKISIRHSVGGGGDRRAEQWLG